MTNEEKRKWLEQEFPWLIDSDESVDGADVIDALVALYERVGGMAK